ncbi:hypothetical protein MJO28_008370 [Puccinia striiformis f. sp. tritici]|uniref:AP complex subunit sigma n=3 Tax=Puccinia striiformis TaxID=27350 RepID=A0A0L0VIM6_9BASI|nr:hypothetical protein Pst134EB_016661 [Puccinia striiformis f. sp. tritici]KAI7949549.1 hypothetical protein MJO28_008370 [Puccinia striiformis f. sp. tritici]KAI9602711.1 hypothetical protein H4Q26_002007 [Puccinia striiformis f. sp. tritici PST-130]KNE99056.1 hypothetical protein PSTG_07707 [Puccinia striiformis f. sp. tritici PST-78]
MIHAVLVFNNDGKPRLSKFYTQMIISSSSPSNLKFELLKTIYKLIQTNDKTSTNFVNLDTNLISINSNLPFFETHPELLSQDLGLVYRNYATLFFVFLVENSTESKLAILDLIQVFVESLDRCFKNVCELDLIFNYDKLDLLLNQIILGGIVLDTSVESIISNFHSQLKLISVK